MVRRGDSAVSAGADICSISNSRVLVDKVVSTQVDTIDGNAGCGCDCEVFCNVVEAGREYGVWQGFDLSANAFSTCNYIEGRIKSFLFISITSFVLCC